MAQPFVGEIRMFAGNFAIAGWAFCDGRLLPISENEVLFTLIGTTYGGDGESTFALPDLRGRIPIHNGNGFILAETGGAEQVTLTVQPDRVAHPPADRDDVGRQPVLAVEQHHGAVDRGRPLHRGHRDGGARVHRRSRPTGGSQPHTNFQPYLCVELHHLAVRHLPPILVRTQHG